MSSEQVHLLINSVLIVINTAAATYFGISGKQDRGDVSPPSQKGGSPPLGSDASKRDWYEPPNLN